jgi:hypothetical protein
LTVGAIDRTRQRPGHWLRPGVVLVALAAAGIAVAAETVPLRLEFVSAAGCGTGADLARRVAMRSPRIAFSDSGHHVVRAEIARSAKGRFDVSLTFAGPAGQRSSRRIDTGSCDEALDAAALILAVTLDPSTSSGQKAPRRPAAPSDKAEAEAAPSSDAPSTSPPESAKEVDSPPADQPPVAIDGRPTPPVPPPPTGPESAADSTFTLSAGIDGRTATAPSPATMFGAGAYVLGGWDRGAVLSPRVRISATYFPERRAAVEGGTALFSLGLLAVDLCPVWVRLGSFGLGGCADVTGGWVTARGADTFAPQTQRRPFGAAGASAAITWEPGSKIEVLGFVNGGISLVRDQFQFRPVIFYEVPRLTLTAGVGVGVRFW